MLSRREEIAVAILLVCARADDALVRTEEAARTANTSRDQAAQAVHALMRAGLVETMQGRHGGIRLARCAEAITLEQVLDAISERRARIGDKCNEPRPVDPLAAIARAAEARVRQTFESFTIADLVSETVSDKLTCFDCSIRLGVLERVAGQRSFSSSRNLAF